MLQGCKVAKREKKKNNLAALRCLLTYSLTYQRAGAQIQSSGKLQSLFFFYYYYYFLSWQFFFFKKEVEANLLIFVFFFYLSWPMIVVTITGHRVGGVRRWCQLTGGLHGGARSIHLDRTSKSSNSSSGAQRLKCEQKQARRSQCRRRRHRCCCQGNGSDPEWLV